MYLAEAVLHGHAYRWHSFGISDAALAAVEDAAAAVLCAAPACTSAAAAPARPQAQPLPLAAGSTAAAVAPEAAAAPATALPAASACPAAAELHASPCAPWATGVFADEDSSGYGGAAAAASLHADTEAVNGQPATAGCASHHSGSPTVHTAGPPSGMAADTQRTQAAAQGALHAEAAGGFVPVDLAARLSAAGMTLRTFR